MEVLALKELEWQRKIMVVDKMFSIDNLYCLAKAVEDGRVKILKAENDREQKIIIRQV